MNLRTLVIAVFLLATMSGELRAETCASDSLGLQKSERLALLHRFLGSGEVGLVNETEGTFVVIDFTKEKATIALYTSGFFDLTAIKRESEIQFCDFGDHLVMRGLGTEEPVEVRHEKLVVGSGGPRKTFGKGPIPAKLAKLHHYLPKRNVASEPALHR